MEYGTKTIKIMKETMKLPTEKVKASRKSPKNMIIYGAPKIGKTSVLAELDDCLIIDLEDGSDMIDALKIKVNTLDELTEVGKAIMKKNKPYKLQEGSSSAWLEHRSPKPGAGGSNPSYPAKSFNK